MKAKFGAAVLIPAAAVVIGAVFAWMGFELYGFWHPKRGPMPGFYPAVIGLALVAAGAFGAVKSLKESPPPANPRDWYVALAVVLIIAFSYVVGMLPALGAYVLIWLRLVQRNSWRTTLIVLAAVSVIVYGVFILWLQVPFEQGVIYRSLWPAY